MVEIALDEIDFRILQQLDEQPDIDVGELSSELGVSKSTIYYRIDQYREQGILKGKIEQIDPQKIGLGLMTVTEINANYAGPEYEEVAEQLSALSGVQRVFFMLGEMSFYVISRVQDHEHLQELMEKIIQLEGVENSTTNFVLRSFKDENRLLTNYSSDDLRRIFDDQS